MQQSKAEDSLHGRYRFCCVLLSVLVMAGFAAILWKAFHLQILNHSVWLQREHAQTEVTVQMPDYRGAIYDRQGRLLAYSVPQPSLSADSTQVKDPRWLASRLSAILGEPQKTLLRRLTCGRPFVWLKRFITDRQFLAVQALGKAGVGLHLINEYKRFYPYGDVGSQVLGFVGLEGNGQEGIEKKYNNLLQKGVSHAEQLRDGYRRCLWLQSGLPLGPGQRSSLQLTLDAYLQYLSEAALAKSMRRYKARSGQVVVMDPNNFQVLAIANWPLFDPNRSQREHAGAWRDRAITDFFEPGSTFKVFLMAAALQDGVVNMHSRFFCENGRYRIGGHTVRDVEPHGWLSLTDILKYSSNIGASKVALQLGAERYYRFIRRFGFGSQTGIALPGESSGLLRPWQKWQQIDLAAAGFGQGIGVTALQLSSAISVIANGGHYARPLIVKGIVDSRGNAVKRFLPAGIRRVIRQKTANEVRDMMETVTRSGGTGVKAVPAGYTVAGKTGTAQVADPKTGGYAPHKYTAVFTGFVPAGNPRLVITVVVHEPHGSIYGGTVAAPVFREIAAKALPYLDVWPTPGKSVPATGWRLAGPGPAAKNAGKPAVRQRGKQRLIPNVVGMSLKKAMLELARYRLGAKFHGSGKVVAQDPAAGSPLRPKTVVKLTLRGVREELLAAN